MELYKSHRSGDSSHFTGGMVAVYRTVFGIGQAPAIVIIFIAAFFPVLLSTVSAIQNIDPVYIKVARNFGIKQPELLFKIVLPAVFPGIASGLHIALGTAWIFLVTGEW